jgi:SAM-dependent methyltransferase
MAFNLQIPGWMPEHELRVIEDLARRVKPHGNVVEVGSFCGRSSWCWAKSVHPTVKVHCLDIWDPSAHPYHPPVAGEKDSDLGRFGMASDWREAIGSLENFQRYTADCPNIVAHRGASPGDFASWPPASADLVFLDGVHHNPTFARDLEFWWERLKPGGIFCGDDHARTHPDVIFTVLDFATQLRLNYAVKGRLWITQKPHNREPGTQNAGPILQLAL